MGIPQYSQWSNSLTESGTVPVGNNNYYNYDYESASLETTTATVSQKALINSASSSSSESTLLSEYLSKGFSTSFVQKYDRELTVVASSLSVLILLTIGACIWCLLGILKRDYDGKDEDSSSTKKRERRGGDDGDERTDDLDSSCGVSDLSVEAGNGGKKLGGTGTKSKIPIISKIFAKQNGNGTRIMAQHRNIITPDKNIPFIVPTIQLPAQPPETCRKPEGSILCDEHQHASSSDPQPSTSKGQSSSKALLLANQFFPQLENPESDSCPLVAFTLFYELSTQILNVRLLEGRNFPDSVNHAVSVKVYPGRLKQNTKEFRARSPVYNVEFCYHVRKPSLLTKILKLRAVIPGNPKRIIGYVNVALKDIPGFDITPEEITEDLRSTSLLWRRVELPSVTGEGVRLRVGLKWSPEPSPGELK